MGLSGGLGLCLCGGLGLSFGLRLSGGLGLSVWRAGVVSVWQGGVLSGGLGFCFWSGVWGSFSWRVGVVFRGGPEARMIPRDWVCVSGCDYVCLASRV